METISAPPERLTCAAWHHKFPCQSEDDLAHLQLLRFMAFRHSTTVLCIDISWENIKLSVCVVLPFKQERTRLLFSLRNSFKTLWMAFKTLWRDFLQAFASSSDYTDNFVFNLSEAVNKFCLQARGRQR